MNKGMSLIEILIAVTIFAVLGIITTSAIALTLKGSKKSESSLKVRENIGYSLSVIERQLRNADSISACNSTSVNYLDSLGNSASFSCIGNYIASGSAMIRLTSDEIAVTSCSFTCELGGSTSPSVSVSLEACDAQSTGIDGASITISTKVFLRTY